MAERDDTSGWWSGRTLRMLGGEIAALAKMALSVPLLPFATSDTLKDHGSHATPVVLIHGLFGSRTDFGALRGFLGARGIRRFATYSYAPRIDYQRLAAGLAERIDAVRRDTGAAHVDVVAHSLGGLTARYLVETGRGAMVRRLVTLGSPYWTTPHPTQELAIFGADDVIVPPPGRRSTVRAMVVRDCGHLGLLHDRRALGATARFLSLSALAPRARARPAAFAA